jgi:exodeoxyribonuclease-1
MSRSCSAPCEWLLFIRLMPRLRSPGRECFCYYKQMAQTFFFYDLETSGLSGRNDRVMQFAGIRTDMNLNPVGEPYNVLVALNDDTLPSPEALLVTGITPQQTVADGYTEAQFADLLLKEVFIEDTITVGFNNIRFDDEFVRHLFWRTFRDPYEWSWRDGRSRWDLLDVVRITRALRPEGIKWPVDSEGRATNRLELLSKENGIDHFKAHDALSDVEALIAVTKLIKEKQPQLYAYLLKIRDKKEIKKLVNLDEKQPFVYTSGRYSADHDKTTVAFPLTSGKNGSVVVYDLRIDPTPFVTMDQKALAKLLYASWEERKAEGFTPLPAKELQYNHAPAVAPLGVLEQGDGWNKIHLDKETIEKHKKILLQAPGFAETIRGLFESKPEYKKSPDVEAQLYDGFLNDADKLRVQMIAAADTQSLSDMHPDFQDERLSPLLLHYKARNFPKSLSADEAVSWEQWRVAHLQAQLVDYSKSIERLGKRELSDNQQFILQELQLWLESIAPSDVSDPSSPD